jgi:hypothetical protein
MATGSIEEMADSIAALMEQRLLIRGATLADKLRRGGRSLPRGIRAEAALLADAARQAGHPRLLHQIDLGRVTRAHETCLRHLQGLNRAARRRAAIMGTVESIAFRLLAVALLLAAVLYWRGFL